MKAHLHTILTPFVLLLALALGAAPIHAADGASPGKVNINEAEVGQLTFLPRIGPALAQRIIDFREENGKFESTEDLILVRGIGEKTFALLEPFVATEGKTTLARKLRTSDAEAAHGSGSDGKKSEKPASKEEDAGEDRSDRPS